MRACAPRSWLRAHTAAALRADRSRSVGGLLIHHGIAMHSAVAVHDCTSEIHSDRRRTARRRCHRPARPGHRHHRLPKAAPAATARQVSPRKLMPDTAFQRLRSGIGEYALPAGESGQPAIRSSGGALLLWTPAFARTALYRGASLKTAELSFVSGIVGKWKPHLGQGSASTACS